MVHPRILAWHNDLEQQELSMKGSEHDGEEWFDMDVDDDQEGFWG